jgi:hypothetical protein
MREERGWLATSVAPVPPELGGEMQKSVHIRPACLQDGVEVLSLLEDVGYYPEPISFAQTFRKTLANPGFLIRVAHAEGRIVGMASLSMRYHLGIGGLLACLDEIAIRPGVYAKRAERLLTRATLGRARALGARHVVNQPNEWTPPPRAAQLAASAAC